MEKVSTQILPIVEWCADDQSPDDKNGEFNDVFDLVYQGYHEILNLTVSCYEINLLLRHFHAVFRVIQTCFDDLNLSNHSGSSTTSFYTDKLDCI